MRIHYKDTREKQITLDLCKGKSGFAYCLFASFQSPYKWTAATFSIVFCYFSPLCVVENINIRNLIEIKMNLSICFVKYLSLKQGCFFICILIQP